MQSQTQCGVSTEDLVRFSSGILRVLFCHHWLLLVSARLFQPLYPFPIILGKVGDAVVVMVVAPSFLMLLAELVLGAIRWVPQADSQGERSIS